MRGVILRKAKLEDVSSLCQLAQQASEGLTGLSKDATRVEQQILDSFTTDTPCQESVSYLFCLEEIATENILGCCGISSSMRPCYPFCYYALEPLELDSPWQNPNLSILRPHKMWGAATELKGIFLQKQARCEGLGKLLSYGRFLFMKQFRHLFATKVFADVRGTITEEGTSPFWDATGFHFSPIPFSTLCQLYIEQPHKTWQLLPPYPIYTALLPQNMQQILGMPHERSQGALALLEQQGFKRTHLIHPMDAGPRLEADIDEILVIQHTRTLPCHQSPTPTCPTHALISKQSDTFVATIGTVVLTHDHALVDPQTFQTLDLSSGDSCLIYPLSNP